MGGAASLFDDFVAAQPFKLDGYQVTACEALVSGRSVLVAAPTGSGKTLIGEFAVRLAVTHRQRAFYTTPIKALSNQKFRDFARSFGSEQVGLLTGDTVINSAAPIIVMTTEVLRNMLYEGSSALVGLTTVVMDEVHYLADRERGAVWEEVILHLPESVRLVALSATVSNAEEFGDWLNEVRGDTEVVVSETRPVPLRQQVVTRTGLADLFETGSTDTVNPELVRQAEARERQLRGQGTRSRSAPGGRFRRGGTRISRPTVLDRLRSAELLPALVFIFSRAGCEDAVTQCVTAGVRLTSSAEKARIREIADTRCALIPEEDLAVLGYHSWRDELERGLAAHHAGMLPLFKETVEELFTLGLVKAVFATETLALGINMPARSVVLERLIKWDGQAHVDLTAGQYTQLTGRAGRRGIDDVGVAAVVWHDAFDPRQLAGLASTRTYPLRSSFRPSYNMAVNLVDRLGTAAARELLETSFAQFQADRTVVGVAAQVRRHEEAMAGYRASMHCDLGDFDEYSRLRQHLTQLEKRGDQERAAARHADIQRRLLDLAVGDVIYLEQGRRTVPAVVVVTGSGPQALTTDRRVRKLSAPELPACPEVVGRLRVPGNFEARSANWRRELARELIDAVAAFPKPAGRSKQRRSKEPPSRHRDEIDRLRKAIRAHPCHACPDREQHARWAQRYLKLERNAEKLRVAMRKRTGNVAAQFDRVCALLVERGYLDVGEGAPTDTFGVPGAGRMLAAMHADQDLLTCEALREGVCSELTAPELAAICASLVHESRAATADAPPARLPPGDRLRTALCDLDELAGDLAELEARHRLDFVRLPDFGIVRPVWGWAMGESLDRVLSYGELTAGDFVRGVRRVIDLLGQVEAAAPALESTSGLADTARQAADLLRRGVVAYSSFSA